MQESGKFLLAEGIREIYSWGIRNPGNVCLGNLDPGNFCLRNPESGALESRNQLKESEVQCLESRFQDYLRLP